MNIITLSDYNIYFGAIQQTLPAWLSQRQYSLLVVICDDNTAKLCLPRVLPALPAPVHCIQTPPGEQHKHIGTCQHIWKHMLQSGADRKALVINVGGGVIGDMGGFCAATFKRGVDFVQLPTTLLSQVDASVGGKLGIDFAEVKNSIGVFSNPQAVFIDPAFLNTLSERELRSGFAEIIKHSLIADAAQWQAIVASQQTANEDWAQWIAPSVNIKKQIVEVDPFEHGIRKSLNFGHTIGHAVESLRLPGEAPLLHGEAIAIGMVCETWLSWRLVGLPLDDMTSINKFLIELYGHEPIPAQAFEYLLALLRNDKKNEHNRILFSLIPSIGKVAVNQEVDTDDIIDSLNYYNSLNISLL